MPERPETRVEKAIRLYGDGGELKHCPTCHGRGSEPENTNHTYGPAPWRVCRRCEGNGWVPKDGETDAA